MEVGRIFFAFEMTDQKIQILPRKKATIMSSSKAISITCAILLCLVAIASCNGSTNEAQIEATISARLTASAPTFTPIPTSTHAPTPTVDPDEQFQTDIRNCIPAVQRLDKLRLIIASNMDDRSIMCGDYLDKNKVALDEVIACFSNLTVPQNDFLRSAREKYISSANYQLDCWREFKAICDIPGHVINPTPCTMMNSEMDKAHVFVEAWKSSK